ncbi:MAG: hypothetical protein RTV41_06120, partial [Candidatus Thorarchaeota archaeon]
MVRNDGEPLYGRSIEDDVCIDAQMLPSLVRNSVAMMQSTTSTSVDRVYILEMEDCIWAYSFFHTFALVSLAS